MHTVLTGLSMAEGTQGFGELSVCLHGVPSRIEDDPETHWMPRPFLTILVILTAALTPWPSL